METFKAVPGTQVEPLDIRSLTKKGFGVVGGGGKTGIVNCRSSVPNEDRLSISRDDYQLTES